MVLLHWRRKMHFKQEGAAYIGLLEFGHAGLVAPKAWLGKVSGHEGEQGAEAVRRAEGGSSLERLRTKGAPSPSTEKEAGRIQSVPPLGMPMEPLDKKHPPKVSHPAPKPVWPRCCAAAPLCRRAAVLRYLALSRRMQAAAPKAPPNCRRHKLPPYAEGNREAVRGRFGFMLRSAAFCLRCFPGRPAGFSAAARRPRVPGKALPSRRQSSSPCSFPSAWPGWE